jgi:predicted RNA-binding protein with PIN domain
MLYLIDGHNLVPKIPGLSLSDLDDEMKLVQLLQDYARIRRKQVEVFFDNSPPGQPLKRKIGAIIVKFSRPGSNADEEIRLRLSSLGNAARNCVVVSSDQRVKAYGREARARVISSDTFSQQLQSAFETSSPDEVSGEGEKLTASEIEEWLRIFGDNKDKNAPKSG